MEEKRNTNYMISPRIADDLFSHSSMTHLQIEGDQKSFAGFDDNFIEEISTKGDLYKSNLENFQSNFIISEENVNTININENDDEVNSLGEKNTSLSRHMRKLSVEFLEKLYKEGTTSSSSTEGEIDNSKKHYDLKLEPNNPYVYSFTSHHPFSFFYGNNKAYCYQSKNKNLLLVPAPTLISNDAWTKKPDLSKNGILHEMKKSDKHGLVLVDPKVMVKFKGIVANMIKQILLAAFGNKISLPVRIFEPKCLLQRVGDYWVFANKYLLKAAEQDISNLERFKLVMAFGLSSLYISCNQLKPFNPLLGETFQGELESGGVFYIEHVSHRPLISRFLLLHEKYQISGYFEYAVRPESLGSVIQCHLKGPVTVSFKNINQEVTFNIPVIKLTNAKSEKDRGAHWIGSLNFVDVKNNYKAVVKMAENHKRIHEVRGLIFSYKFPSDYKFKYEDEIEFGKKFELNRTKNYKVLGKVSGSWLERLYINDRVYWDIDVDEPEWIRPVKSCLPSDGRYREDFIWLYRSFYCAKNEEERLKYESISQEWKILMEKFQRVEREMRIKARQKAKKK